jgi:hypothetical protein
MADKWELSNEVHWMASVERKTAESYNELSDFITGCFAIRISNNGIEMLHKI